jgi:predicted protein tyrosine phosphatase
LFRGHPTVEARSAGTDPRARIKLAKRHLDWADVIYCMEDRHADAIRERFGDIDGKQIIVLDIPDKFRLDDPNLIEMLRLELAEHFRDKKKERP